MACGSNDTPRCREPEAPNQYQESREKKEVRNKAEMENRMREWNMKTTNVGNGKWCSREEVGCVIHAYMKSRGSSWAGKVTHDLGRV